MTRSPMIIGAQIHPRMRPPPCSGLAKCGFCDTSAKTCGRFDRTTWTIEVGLVVEVETHAEKTPQVVDAAAAHDHQTVPLNHLYGAAVVGDDSLQLAQDCLERLLEGQRLPEHLRHGQERLGALPCALHSVTSW